MDAAIQLFLVNPSASMSDVALKAGIGRATLYRHFDTRQTLILALATESLQKTDEVLQPLRENNLSAYDLLCEGLRAIMPWLTDFTFWCHYGRYATKMIPKPWRSIIVNWASFKVLLNGRREKSPSIIPFQHPGSCR